MIKKIELLIKKVCDERYRKTTKMNLKNTVGLNINVRKTELTKNAQFDKLSKQWKISST